MLRLIIPVRANPRGRARGFTIVELMVTIAILGILAAVAAPSFTSIMERWRVRSAVENLESSLYFARSEAIKLGGQIEVQPQSGSWNNGWKVVDVRNNKSLQEIAMTSKTTVNPGGISKINFDRWGMPSPWPGFTFENGSASQRLCMSAGGRIRTDC